MKSATPFFSSSTYCQKVRKFSSSGSSEQGWKVSHYRLEDREGDGWRRFR